MVWAVWAGVTAGEVTAELAAAGLGALAELADLFRFQQSGWIFLVSSAMTLARCEKWSRSVCGSDFQASPSSTLMALRCNEIYVLEP